MSPGRVPCFGAIFDWDGVIIDSAKLHEESWHQLAKELGQTIAPENFIRGFGMKSQQIIANIHRWSQDPAEILRITNRKRIFIAKFWRRRKSIRSPELPSG